MVHQLILTVKSPCGTSVPVVDYFMTSDANCRPAQATPGPDKPQLFPNPFSGTAVARLRFALPTAQVVPPADPTLELGPDQWLGSCADTGPATLTATPGFQGYRWSTGPTTASISVSQPGRCVVMADFGCGTLKDSAEVRRYDPRLTPLLVSPPALCLGQSLTLSAVPGFGTLGRWPHPTGRPTGPLPPLTARTANGCLVRNSVNVSLLAPPVIPAGFPHDTLICAQEAWRLTVPAPPASSSYQWSSSSTDPAL